MPFPYTAYNTGIARAELIKGDSPVRIPPWKRTRIELPFRDKIHLITIFRAFRIEELQLLIDSILIKKPRSLAGMSMGTIEGVPNASRRNQCS